MIEKTAEVTNYVRDTKFPNTYIDNIGGVCCVCLAFNIRLF